MHRLLYIAFLVSTLMPPVAAQELRLPNKPGSVKFAVIGDTGTGDQNQRSIANELASWRTRYPFDFVVMMGDNIYGGEKPSDFDKKFAIPYKPLLDAGIKFYAALGVGKIFESAELLIQTNGRDPITILSIAALLAVVAVSASIWPAHRATRLDPVVALRNE